MKLSSKRVPSCAAPERGVHAAETSTWNDTRRSIQRVLCGAHSGGVNAALRPENRSRCARSKTRSKHGAGGFTLLELLVTIGILGVLAALLLPALARGKQKAQITQCLGNSRQLTVAILLYAGDHTQTYPLALYKPQGDSGPVWGFDDFIYSYLGQSLTEAEKMAHAIPLAKRSRLLTCPVDKAPPSITGPDVWRRTYSLPEANMANGSGGSPLRNAADGGIGAYYSTFWGPFPPANPALHVGLIESVVTDPTRTLAVVERPHPGNWGGNDHYAVTRCTGDQLGCFASVAAAEDYHGGGRFVYAYCDGRVELLPRQKTWGKNGAENLWAGDWTIRTDD